MGWGVEGGIHETYALVPGEARRKRERRGGGEEE
jgi:hypothetical protein